MVGEAHGGAQPTPCTPAVGGDRPRYRFRLPRQVYEGEVTELTPEETENPLGGYGVPPPAGHIPGTRGVLCQGRRSRTWC